MSIHNNAVNISEQAQHSVLHLLELLLLPLEKNRVRSLQRVGVRPPRQDRRRVRAKEPLRIVQVNEALSLPDRSSRAVRRDAKRLVHSQPVQRDVLHSALAFANEETD